MMKQIMLSDAEANLPLRCRATEAAGLIAVAIGRDSFMVIDIYVFGLILPSLISKN